MANVRAANSYYIDTVYAASVATTTEQTVQDARVYYVLVTSTSGAAQVVLQDNGVTKLDLRLAASSSSELFRFEEMPVRFSTSIRASTLTNAVVTVVFDESRR